MKAIIPLVCFLPAAAWGQLSWQGTPDGDGLTMIVRPADLYRGHSLTGMPYSAEQISEHLQTLADGTHIRQPRRVEKIWRDSQARTRWERSVAVGPGQGNVVSLIEIRDPVGGFYYVLDEQNKIAHRLTLTAPPARQPDSMPHAAATPATPRPETSWEKLGTQNVEGLISEGSRSTTKWPVDSFGNDRPLTSSFERWDSTELKVLVLAKNFDPRGGEDTTRLTNINRAEPDASWFIPPAGYTVVDEKDSFTIPVKRQ
jgi:hypothetical protein